MNKRHRKLTSVIWKIEPKDFATIVASSKSMVEVSSRCGLGHTSKNFSTIRRRIAMEGIRHDHFTPCHHAIAKLASFSALPLSSVLIEHSTYSRNTLKRRLIREGLLNPKKCSVCGMGNQWNEKPLIMILDHINGIFDDNRLENLRLVCPNCNSQLDTHGGKHNRKPPKMCSVCSKVIPRQNKSGKCNGCSIRSRPAVAARRAMRPSPADFLAEIQRSSWSAVGEKYGVSDNAIRKWARQMGLPTDKSIKTLVINKPRETNPPLSTH